VTIYQTPCRCHVFALLAILYECGVKLECIGGTISVCSYSRPELLLIIQQPREDGLQARRVVANILEDEPQTADEALSSMLELFLDLSKYSLKHVTKFRVCKSVHHHTFK